MTMNVLIIGGGKVGANLATYLGGGGYRVKVVEARAELLPRLQHDLPSEAVLIGSGTDLNVLEAAGIRQANVVAAVTGADEVNLIITSLARFEFNVPRIIARVNDPKNAWMFTPEMGVDVALNQTELMAHLIAEEMSLGDMMVLLKLRKGQYSLVEEKVHPASPAVGQRLRDLPLPAGCSLVAVIHRGELCLPEADVALAPADEVLAVAHISQLRPLAALLGGVETTSEASLPTR